MGPRISLVEWVNAISVVVLVAVTAYYAWTTRRILRESEKMRKAAEKQAAAASAQASAAFDTLYHLRQQVEELQGLGKSIVRAAIDSAVSAIENWRRFDIRNNFAIAEAFPPSDGLVPGNAQAVLEHARRISEDCFALLSGAFDDLRMAHNEIEALRRGAAIKRTEYFEPARFDPDPMLTSAFSKLQQVRKFVS
jgi:hypothetical protein